jgi:NADPH2:quinone reductase
MKAIRIERTGGPEVMELVDIELPPPAKGELRVRHTAIGLNYVDTYHRSGLYPVSLPSILGQEAAGVVEAVGPGVKGFRKGDRIAYGNGPIGAYSEARNIPAVQVSKLPKSISDEVAAAVMLKGMTVRYLLKSSYKVKRGETILLHAAAGGVGLIATQWARALGAKVIGTVGSEEKRRIAEKNGCHFVINYRDEDVVKRVREITKGKGVPVVYDGVGQATLMTSLDCLRPHGMLVTFGNASGPVQALDTRLLATRGSLFVTRPTLGSFVSTPRDLQSVTSDLFKVVKSGKVKARIGQRYPLADAAKAHRDLEGRATTGSTILIP